MRRITGAILRVTVPAIIMRSACRGEARKTPAPNRSMSYRDDTVAIISMAQQARPNVIGNKADFRDQFTSASRLVVRIFASNCRSRRLIFVFPLLLQIKGDCQGLPRPRVPRAQRAFRQSPRSIPFERSLLPRVPESDQ